MDSKKTFLVDVPVLITIWCRPECQEKQWAVIKEARPSTLFILSDGGRNEKEWEAINQNRKMIDDDIDWECKVYKLYENSNNGLYAMAKKSFDLIWKNVDRCIFTEDDQIMSVSFFSYCAELLEKYKDDTRIECICGMNHLGKWKSSSDYFFSRQGSIWGTATWKRVFDDRNNGFGYGDDAYIMHLLKQRTRHNKIVWKRLNAYSKSDIYEGHVANTEFWYDFDMYSQNRLQIIPNINMIKNIGFGEGSEHAKNYVKMPRSIRKIFNMDIYEMDMPIKHPKYVIPDVDYEKARNKIMHSNPNPVLLFFVRSFHAVLYLLFNPKRFVSKFKKETKIEK